MFIVHSNRQDTTDFVSSNDLKVNSCGLSSSELRNRTELDDVLTYRPSGRKDYQLLLVCSGITEFYLNEKWSRVSEGQTVLYRPKEPQIYRIRVDMPAIVRWIHFTGTRVEELLSICGFSSAQVYSPGACEEAEELYRRIGRELQRQEPLFEYMVSSMLEQLLFVLGRKMTDGTGSNINEYTTRQIVACTEYISKHFREIRSIEELADYCHLSKYHFLRSFRKIVGRTPYAYLIEVRMKAASELLCDGRNFSSISEVARCCGYSDPMYFSKVFSQHCGCTPTQYRERFLREKRNGE